MSLHAEKISAQGFTIWLECTWACKFHVQALRCAQREGESDKEERERGEEAEGINKSALSDTRCPREQLESSRSLIASFTSKTLDRFNGDTASLAPSLPSSLVHGRVKE